MDLPCRTPCRAASCEYPGHLTFQSHIVLADDAVGDISVRRDTSDRRQGYTAGEVIEKQVAEWLRRPRLAMRRSLV